MEIVINICVCMFISRKKSRRMDFLRQDFKVNELCRIKY